MILKNMNILPMDNPNVKVMPIMVSLIIGAFFAILNETLLNIALTTLMAEFSILHSQRCSGCKGVLC